MKLTTLFSIVVLVALSACSSNDEKSQRLKAVSLVDFEPTVSVERLWTQSVGSGFDKRYSKFVPGISDDRIFVSDVEGRIFSVNKQSGELIWKTKLEKKALSAGVGVHNNQIYVGTYDGELIALDASNGNVLWQADSSSEILAVPAANSDVVVIQTIDGRLFGYDVATGEQRWRYDHPVPALTLRGLADPVITRTQLVAAFGTGQIVVLNPSDGAQIWSGRVSSPKGVNELEKVVDVDGTPIVSGGYIFAATHQGAMAAFSKAKGNVIWKRDISTVHTLAATGSTVFAVDEDSHLIAHNAATGNPEWSNELMHRRGLGAPLAFDDYVLAIDDDGYVHVLSQDEGRFADRFKPPGKGFSARPQATGNQFIVLSDNGKLSAYGLAE